PTLNEWAHFALVYDGAGGGDDSRLYVNGEVAGNQTVELDTNPTTRTFQIGLWSGTSFDGVIDDVRVYKKALTEAEIAEAMRGNPLLAGSPNPAPGAIVDIRDATMLTWTAGDTAASHDVYFGADRAAVAAVGNDAPEFQGNQPGTSFSLAGLVEFGGGDYFWRIDEVEADETVQTGYVWKFTIPDHLIVDDFESYSNEVGSRAFEKWIDGIGFTQPVDTPGNDTGALVGHDIWTIGTPYTTIMETGNVHGGNQAMPIYYDNTLALGISEVDRTFTPGQNWTVEGVTTLVVHIRGEADNTGNLYVEINGANVPYDGDPTDIASGEWIAWEIDLASVGVSLTNITTLTIGIEGGQTGVLYVDDIILTKP
ncbi:MAG: LamG domain-containing protein, partial [Sedimentisphaerales bacterium]|nr:LamG domain-containing protein [Sedimentisphaerales bacterium]